MLLQRISPSLSSSRPEWNAQIAGHSKEEWLVVAGLLASVHNRAHGERLKSLVAQQVAGW